MCEKCYGPEDDNCLSCWENSTLSEDSDFCGCEDGYYYAGDYCDTCSASCLTCIDYGWNGCLTCDEPLGREMNEDYGSCDCVDGTFGFEDMADCWPCPHSCSTCSNEDTCDSCDTEAFRHMDESSM